MSYEGDGRVAGRRSREEAREEILAVAERFLWHRPLRELTVGTLMEGTTIGRSAFYVYFHDRYDLVAALLERLSDRLLESAAPWLTGPRDTDPRADIHAAIKGTVAVWAEHGPVLRAIADAASQDQRIENSYRLGLLKHSIVAVSERILAGQAVGRIRDLDAGETAAALILMNERYLAERMGRPPQADQDVVVETLYGIWTATLYGQPSRRVGSGRR